MIKMMIKPTTDLGTILTTVTLVAAMIGATISYNNAVNAEVAKAAISKGYKCIEIPPTNRNLCVLEVK